MRISKYYYNPKTCRYEPHQTSISSLVSYAILFSISTLLIFWGVLTLHSKLFLSEKGKELKRENITLTRHQASLLGELANVDNVLVKLNDQNSDLHKKLFETSLLEATASTQKNNYNLLGSATDFKSAIQELREKSTAVSKLSKSHNAFFSTVEVNDKELQFLMSIPAIQPIENATLTKLVSGF